MRMIASAAILLLAAGTVRVMAQGSLTPPGAPAPTMKTLEQVEPRIPISQTGYEITAPGSYYLTTNLITSGATAGITISTNDVTLDLNGFSILGGGAHGIGIKFRNRISNMLVRNGVVRDCMYSGVFATSITHCIFRNLRIINNARASSAYNGLQAGSEAVVEHCHIATLLFCFCHDKLQ